MRSVIVFNILDRVHIDFLHIVHLFMRGAFFEFNVFALINTDELHLAILDGSGLAPLVKQPFDQISVCISGVPRIVINSL